jgi:NADH dehydrogenase ubiquinone Fe-S protein 4
MQARIYQPAKPAVSSGRFRTRFWIVELEPRSPLLADRLIGWVGSDDTDQQIRMRFETKDEAIAYCERRGIDFSLAEPQKRIVRPKAYADNFIHRV